MKNRLDLVKLEQCPSYHSLKDHGNSCLAPRSLLRATSKNRKASSTTSSVSRADQGPGVPSATAHSTQWKDLVVGENASQTATSAAATALAGSFGDIFWSCGSEFKKREFKIPQKAEHQASHVPRETLSLHRSFAVGDRVRVRGAELPSIEHHRHGSAVHSERSRRELVARDLRKSNSGGTLRAIREKPETHWLGEKRGWRQAQ